MRNKEEFDVIYCIYHMFHSSHVILFDIVYETVITYGMMHLHCILLPVELFCCLVLDLDFE